MSRFTRPVYVTFVSLLLLGLRTGAALGQQRRQQTTPQASAQPDSTYARLRYRHVGPIGNRVSAVTGVPDDPNVYYAGAASGGIWKTTDGGVHWTPIFDDQPVQSIGALAVAPSDANMVWAGTGEAFIRSHISVGEGIFKSTDAGKTWARMGLEKTGRIGRIVIHPTNPDVVFACALGHAYGPQPERGVFRTADGGRTWERVLFVDENTGCSDVAMDPNNPRILFAGMWQLVIRTWGRESGGPGSGLYVSRDGGSTWQKLSGSGLPEREIGKIALAIARTNSSRVYALIETGDGVPWHGKETDRGELWRSDDGGATWQLVSYDRQLSGRQPYYTRLAVSPDNEHEAYFLTAAYSKTIDGGATTLAMTGDASPGGDHHDVWIDPTNANRIIIGNDNPGVSISVNRARTWHRTRLPIAQMYHVTVDNQVPYFLYGNRQDGPSFRGPSNSRTFGFAGGGGSIARGEWHSVGGGESGWATPDTVDPNIIWSSASGSGSVGGIVVRFDLRNKQGRNVEVWPVSTVGHPAESVKYRFVWTMPVTISPHDNKKVYVGSQHVHVTTDGGNSWQVISPDLTLNDRSRMGISGGLTPDNIGVEYGGTIFAIAESPVVAGLLWAGTNDGLVHVSRNGGQTWENVTKNLPGLPAWGTISNIEPSRYDAGTAYLTVDLHQVDNRDPYVYKTSDYGKTWKLIVNGIPKSMLSYAHVLREDPVRRGLLYLGTENALYVSFNDGESWEPLQNNLPHAPVYWLVVQPHFNDLVVSTYGRGFYILDDITPLQELTPEVRATTAHLFRPRAAWRFRPVAGAVAMEDDQSSGDNPAYGASINYWLAPDPGSEAKAKAKAKDVSVQILDSGGRVVRKLTATKDGGINRVWWDLRYEQSKEARLRTAPMYAPEIKVGEDGTRNAPNLGRFAVLAPPGMYTVKLTADGQEFTQALEVRKDPHSGGTLAEIQQQAELLMALQGDLNTVVDMVNGIEIVRSQLGTLKNVLAAVPGEANVKAATDVGPVAEALDKKLIDVEGELIQMRMTGRGQDGIRWPVKLGVQLTYLMNGISSSDFAPTTQQRAVAREFAEKVRALEAQLDEVVRRDVPALNEQLRQRNVPNIIAAM